MMKTFDKLKKHYYVCYVLLFLIVCVIVFSVFWYNGKSFVWDGDGLDQHFIAYIYYGRYLRTIVKSILFDHTLSIPAFSMSIGYGSDVMMALCYYVIGDPICALTVFVPTRYMVYFYNFAVMLRFFLAGLTFSKLCFYFNKKNDEKFSKTAIMIGAFVYAFCGYALYYLHHPFFLNAMIYFPLVIMGIEMIIDKKKPYVFIVGVFLSAISNFLFFYMIVILTVLYVVWRLISVYHKDEIKNALCSLGKITIYSIIGTAMSAVTLIPIIIFFLGDARSDNGYIHSLLYTLEDYQESISGFIAANTRTTDYLILGFASIALIAVFMLFFQKKKYKSIKIAFVIMVAMMAIPIVGRIMNGYSYVSNRWVFGFCLLVGYIVVLTWDKLLATSSNQLMKIMLCLCGYFALCMFMTSSRTIDFFIPMILAFVFLCCLIFRKGKYRTAFTAVCVICVFANIGINVFLLYSPRFGNIVTQYADNDDILNNYKYTEANVINRLTDDDNKAFSRYTGSITLNRSLYSGQHTTQYYWSLSNGYITDFQRDTALNYGSPEQYSGVDSRTGLSTLANVRYYVKKSSDADEAPYGFKSIGSGTDYGLSDFLKEKFGEDYDVSNLTDEEKQSLENEYLTSYEVYENEFTLPFGYTYSNSISQEDYASMTPIQKQEAMMQAVVLDDENGDGLTPSITSRSVDYTIDQLDGVQWEDNEIIVTKENGKATLLFDGAEDSENYIYIEGLNYTGTPPMDQYSDIEWAVMSVYDKNSVKYDERFWVEPSQVKLNFDSKDTDNKTASTSITYNTPYYKWGSDQHDYLINLYYDESPRQSITITFPTTGVYTYDDLEVLCQPMDDYEDQIVALKDDTLENVDFHDDNSAFVTNEITGNITLGQDKYLLLTIPYSSGWTAYVDGKEQDVLQANTMFMALKLNAGEHNIELKYKTPGLTAGICISLSVFVIFILIVIFSERRNKISKNNEKKVREGNKS